jgi:hypothetical protein
MASGKPTPDAPGLSTTRQMIDELDALMERMLALPVNDSATDDAMSPRGVSPSAPMPSAPMAAAPRPAPPRSSGPLTAKLTLLQVPVDDPPLDPAHPGPNPSHLPALNATTSLPPLAAAPSMSPSPFSDRIVPPVLVPSTEIQLPEPTEPDDGLTNWFILPLLWSNRLFDRCTYCIGESGGWLRTPAGRMALGMTGVLLIAAAGLWLMRDWLGWAW